MFVKTITFNDFNGSERTEDFYFNLTKAEIMKMELTTKGGFTEKVQRIIKAQDVPSLVEVFEEIIKCSYGIKTPDGRGFVKKAEYLEDFMATEAYSELITELFSNADAASEFINGIIPTIKEAKPAIINA